ncbi:biotin-dependent carboxyltransferase family protein [Psychromonas sp. KJ10-10]|uniref:5-oxoprolinase subunit C family protein n=1 Tax=Psychromonas sp. KJ10-10 TaxID=3391823 RepID=UPI0039B4203B
MTLQITQAGTLSLIQDLGRFGYQDVGVTSGGPMDKHAFYWANRLLDNPPNASQIEITMGPFRAVFEKSTTFSICGAEVAAKLNNQIISNWHSWVAKSGDILTLSYSKKGLRTYFAIAGGFDIPKTLGSTSTVVRDGFGGVTQQGEKLRDGDILTYQPNVIGYYRSVLKQFIPDYADTLQIGVLPTYQFDKFDKEAINTFFSQVYTVSPLIDRMGYRLNGATINFPQQHFISEGIVPGSIQIPANGQPIVLMRDRQTIGGYPKIGCVCNRDLNLLAQATPDTKVQFFYKIFSKLKQNSNKNSNIFLAYNVIWYCQVM